MRARGLKEASIEMGISKDAQDLAGLHGTVENEP